MTGVKVYDPADSVQYRHPGQQAALMTSADRIRIRAKVDYRIVVTSGYDPLTSAVVRPIRDLPPVR